MSRDLDKQRLYKDLAWTWPIISPPEDYREEARQFQQAISKHSKIEVRTLLDIGCGGGHNDYHLKKYYKVMGVDLNEGMLRLARDLNPEVAYVLGDMRNVRLGEKFGTVIIADSITYMLNEEDLKAAFVTAYAHLKPGGVFCTYIEETPETLKQYKADTRIQKKEDIEIVFIESVYDPDTSDTTYESVFVYIIREGGKITIETDSHIHGIFPLDTWERLLAEVGFEAHRMTYKSKYPFFTCVKPL
ncbi:MAG: class I SAM-dependent methyltransferase [Thermoplasmata archaeon]|nr:class I SAM-dependent methyltransferase [Thermoplasmata archaeon]